MKINDRLIHRCAWLTIAILALIDWIWMSRIGFRLAADSARQSAVILGAVVLISLVLRRVSRYPYRDPDRQSFYQHVADVFSWIAVMAAFTHVGVLFQYLCVSSNFPSITPILITLDGAIGFHWPAVYAWVLKHQYVDLALSIAYKSGFAQLLAIPFVLAATRHSRDYAEFVVQFMVASIVVILISLPLPAESAFTYFSVRDPAARATVSDFLTLRSGSLRELAFPLAQGLVSFPSLHTILALCFAYSLRHVRYLFPLGVFTNLCMIISTPTHGGHYLCDVLSGLIVGALIILWVRKLFAQAKKKP